MTRKTPVNVAASVRARLLTVSKERREDFTLTLMNYAAERFLYRLAQSTYRDRFVLKGAMLFAVRVGERYRATRDLDLLGLGEASEAAVATAIRAIATTNVHDDGVAFDVEGLEVNLIREDNAYGGIRAVMQARLAEARIHLQIDVGFGDAITPAATDLQFPTLLADMPSPNVLAYPTETIVAEKVEAMVHLGLSNSRLKDFTDLAIAARRTAFDGTTLIAAIRATFRRRGTALPETEVGGLSEQFVQDARAQANWKAYVSFANALHNGHARASRARPQNTPLAGTCPRATLPGRHGRRPTVRSSPYDLLVTWHSTASHRPASANTTAGRSFDRDQSENGNRTELPRRLQMCPRRVLLGPSPILAEHGLAEEHRFGDGVLVKDGHEHMAS